MVVLAGLSITLFIVVVSSLGRSSRSRIVHLDKAQTAFYIGYSAMSRFMARLHQTSWSDRDYRDAPAKQFRVTLLDGEYDLHAENTPGLNRDFQTDLYVRVRLDDMTRLFFWRLQYRDDLLDLSNRSGVLYFASIPVDRFPGAAGFSFGSTVDRILAKRAENRETADILSMEVLGVSDVGKIAEILGAPALKATNTAEFPTVANGGLTGMAGLPPIPFPSSDGGGGGGFNDSPLTPDAPAASPGPSPAPSAPADDPLVPPAKPLSLPSSPPVPADPRVPAAEGKTNADISSAISMADKADAWVSNAGRYLTTPSNHMTPNEMKSLNDPVIAEKYSAFTQAQSELEASMRAALDAVKAARKAEPLASTAMNPGAVSNLREAASTASAEMTAGIESMRLRNELLAEIRSRIALLEVQATEQAPR